MQYIPQGPPFVMIDELLSANDTETQTKFLIPQGHLFVENGYFTESGLIENMAQTAAAGTGKKAADEGLSAPVGFIGAVKGLEIYSLPPAGATIYTSITFVMQVMNAHVVNAAITCNDHLVAKAEFQIFLQ